MENRNSQTGLLFHGMLKYDTFLTIPVVHGMLMYHTLTIPVLHGMLKYHTLTIPVLHDGEHEQLKCDTLAYHGEQE
jgi:hypothetical protein